MPSQDISVNRNRGWSLDTASSTEEYAIFSGSGKRLFEPRRQPVNAPGSPGGRVQADEGFVRFLKTHSSPTSQRATTDGRIVHVEPPSAPPQSKLLSANSLRSSIALAAQDIGEGSVKREQPCNNSSSMVCNEFENGTRKPFNPNTNFQVSQGQHLLTEPFPRFYDGQTCQEDVQNAATGVEGSLSRNTGPERDISQVASQGLGTGQNTAPSTARALERYFSTATTSRATPALPQQAQIPAHGGMSTDRAYPYPHYPPKMQGSQQYALDNSQYLPNTTSLALDRVSTAMTLELGDSAQIVSQHPLTTECGAYHGLDLGANQAALYPSLSPMIPQGFQVPPFTNLPMYANQVGFVSPAHYSHDPYNQPASLLSAHALQSFTDASMPLTAPAAPNEGTSLLLEQELALAEATFVNSAEQERMLDQYLAMNMDTMDLQTRRMWTGKRMQIVEERASAKDRMNQLQQAMNTHIARTMNNSDSRSLTSLQPAMQNSQPNRLNVQAPSWVPKAGSDGNKAVKIQDPNKSIATASINTSQMVPPSQGNIDGPQTTPLKPVTTVSGDPFTTQVTDLFSPEKSPVDKWGARLGAPPPELERQQSEQNELLASMANEASQTSAGPQDFTGNVFEPDGSWDAKDGCHLQQVEADHELYLDAIRKDLSTTSVLTFSNGQTVKVEGQRYKQPMNITSSGVETDYWMRKPDPDHRLGASHSCPFERSFDNIKRTPLPQKSMQTQEWVNGIVDVHKQAYSGRAPWITERMNPLSTKGEPPISLQATHATSQTRGTNGAVGHLRGRC